MYRLHYFYKYLEYKEMEERLTYLSETISLVCNSIDGVDTGCGARNITLKDVPLSKYDIQPWIYFDSKLFYQDETIIPSKHLATYNYHKEELESVLQEAVRLANLDYPSLVLHKLVNGYMRHNGLKGNEYIMDVELWDLNIPNIIVQQRFSLLRPLSSSYTLQHSKTIDDETVNIIVPINGLISRVTEFFRMYEKLSLATRERTRLVLAVYGEEGLTHCKDQIKHYSKEYPHSQFTIVQGAGKFTRARALNAGMTALNKEDLAFLCDVDITVTQKFLTRCRRNTFASRQVYYPEVFKWYNMDYVYKVKSKKYYYHGQHIARDTGHWGYYGYGMLCIYKRDYVASGGLDPDIVGWGGEDTEYYERIIGKFEVLRAPDPGLTHQWHDKSCHHLQGNQKRSCYFSKSETLADKRELASYIFKLEEDRNSSRDTLISFL